MQAISVLIVTSESTTRRELRRVVCSDPGLTVAWTTADPQAAAALAAEGRDSVALVDAAIDGGGAAAVRTIRGEAPSLPVVALSLCGDTRAVIEMLRAGATAALAGSDCMSDLRRGVYSAVAGCPHVARDVLTALVDRLEQVEEATGAGEPSELRARIERAVAGEGLSAVFQPIADLTTGRVTGLQALARFAPPPRQAPDAWFAEAAKLGLGPDLELAALHAALQGLPLLSPDAFLVVQIGTELATSERLLATLPADHAGQLVLQLSDHHRCGDYQALAAALVPLRERGLRLAVDGGAASLAALREIATLAPEFIKLERTLTRNVDRDPTRRALTAALVAVARTAGSTVVAEGVGTSSELLALRTLGVPSGLGSVIAGPRKAEECDPDLVQVELPVSDDATEGAESDLPHGLARVRDQRHHSFRDALRTVFETLQVELPDSVVTLTQHDAATRRVRVVAAHTAEGEQALAPGVTVEAGESICVAMADGRGPRLSGDMLAEPRYAALPTPQCPDARSFVGVPLELGQGGSIGALCAMSPTGDAYDERALTLVSGLGTALVAALQSERGTAEPLELAKALQRHATVDWLTGLKNGGTFLDRVDEQILVGRNRRDKGWLVVIDLAGLGEVNARHGRALADLLLKDVATALAEVGRPTDEFGRLDATSFGALIASESPHVVKTFRNDFARIFTRLLAKRRLHTRVVAGTASLHEVESAAEALAAATADLKLVGVERSAADQSTAVA